MEQINSVPFSADQPLNGMVILWRISIHSTLSFGIGKAFLSNPLPSSGTDAKIGRGRNFQSIRFESLTNRACGSWSIILMVEEKVSVCVLVSVRLGNQIIENPIVEVVKWKIRERDVIKELSCCKQDAIKRAHQLGRLIKYILHKLKL